VNGACAWGREMFPAENTKPCMHRATSPVESDMLAVLYSQLCGTHQRRLRALARQLRTTAREVDRDRP
jgi:hypothetical protein